VLLFKPRLHLAWAVWVEYMWGLPLLEKIQHGFESAFHLEIALWRCERDPPEKVHRLTVELQQLRQSLVLGDDGWKEEKRIQNSAPPKRCGRVSDRHRVAVTKPRFVAVREMRYPT
jgi:hypothetical protein